MLEFAHDTLAQRVLFASGRAAENLRSEVARFGSPTVMVIADKPETAAALCRGFEPALVHTDVAPHVPVEKAEEARAAARNHGVDLLVCIGGGSTTGLAKAVALTSGLPVIAVPTTYAGSEATPVWGLTEAARKTTGVDARVLPAAVVYDATLLATLPVESSVASGLNAVAHGVDAMWAPRTDPINQALAVEGVRALAAGLPVVKADPGDLAGHEQCLYGAYLSAVAFASAGSGLHHKVCHVLGGAYDLPHARTHAVVLPHVLAYNAPAAPEAARRIASALGATDPVRGLAALRRTLDAPVALRDHGMRESDLDEAVDLVLPVVPESNPRPVTRESLAALLRNAWTGADPAEEPRP
ncbi:maleylacetate reductase [Saccharothrix australiensis]|uniref:Maleylacetate reductase n=1 Tax=Saccharothrix australiensis TaxID=2072 RepID=A0A495W4K8_9PSEU|nr:maleylacetate reductase [Saccharothrix australiensis]RKT55593.1 maleylacetate reductase [Saccharothrix australiensis]